MRMNESTHISKQTNKQISKQTAEREKNPFCVLHILL